MDREKEINRMVEIAREYSKDIANTPYYKGVVTDMTALYEAGYRKADEVRKETAKEIYERVDKWLDEIVPHTSKETILICLLGWIKAKYGVEVIND